MTGVLTGATGYFQHLVPIGKSRAQNGKYEFFIVFTRLGKRQ
jgi:hypothetical protein